MRFAGYAAIFDRADRGGDVVRAGAFARSLKRWGRGQSVDCPLLWQHEPSRPIGRIEYLKEDRRGLRVIGRLSDGAAGREAAALLKEGAVRGLSFGYRVRSPSTPLSAGFETGLRQAQPLLRTSGGEEVLRELTDLDLVEVSLVTLPMQPKARVHAVESDA